LKPPIFVVIVSLVILLMFSLNFVPASETQPGRVVSVTSSSTQQTSQSSPTKLRGPSHVDVVIEGQGVTAYYSPTTIVVVIGVNNTVIWYNPDIVIHTVTSVNQTRSGNVLFDSGFMNPGQSYTRVFNSTGTYPYICAIHPEMYGEVIVKSS
jgi:plastocyanin